MILLTGTSDELRVTASATTDLDVHASYVDDASGTYTPGRKNTNITSTSATAIVASPASSTSRTVKTVAICNRHTSSVTVTITHTDGTTEVEVVKVALAVDAALHYDEHRGWHALDAYGRDRTARRRGIVVSSGTALDADVLAADEVNNNGTPNTLQDATGFAITVPAGDVHWYRVVVWYTSAATNTGSRWVINTSASLMGRSDYSLTTTSRTTTEGITASDLPAGTGATSAATAANIAILEGFANHSAGVGDATVQVRFSSEVASSAITARAGAVIHQIKVVDGP